MKTHGHSKHGSFTVEIHDEKYTHVSFGDGGIICSIADAFTIMDDLHKRPSMLLREGWHASLIQKNPEHAPSWVSIESGGSYCTPMFSTADGLCTELRVGGKYGTVIATRTFNKE